MPIICSGRITNYTSVTTHSRQEFITLQDISYLISSGTFVPQVVIVVEI